MSFQWSFLATFLYSEIVAVIILLLPFISPVRWQTLFKSRLAKAFTAGAGYYFNFIICVFALLFLDSIRELRKYASLGVKDLSTPHAESLAHMKEFRSQRNFYIAGFALFLWFVVRRLINLLSTCARQMADSTAALKQAEGAQRHFEGLKANDPKKIDSQESEASTGNASNSVELKKREAEVEKYKREAIQAKEDLQTLRERYNNSIEEYDKLKTEHRQAQIQLAMKSDSDSSKDK
ncbi:unnamed protein product [Rotaria socialis]|uniref:Endoplasmic reticulum transmembrane protein n=1 Tax=Rotaria socialis TaxID=392032 RepID=A0A821F733_9BILA|nr:unnamed protein product [Rotaria socialis]CAF3479317.1 unnamed protein product [Rotaria socialis]CAF4433902.1 unnamed protein product [Rotaria socialis]CAF4647463.1 unnamed protein product [Rotaria socialis]